MSKIASKNIYSYLLKHHVSLWDWGQISIKLGTNHDIDQKLSTFIRRKRVSMFTGFKVSLVACKCVFYRPEHIQGGIPWN